MARPYSQDLRRPGGRLGGGLPFVAGDAALFEASVASVFKGTQRWRASGTAAAKQMDR